MCIQPVKHLTFKVRNSGSENYDKWETKYTQRRTANFVRLGPLRCFHKFFSKFIKKLITNLYNNLIFLIKSDFSIQKLHFNKSIYFCGKLN